MLVVLIFRQCSGKLPRDFLSSFFFPAKFCNFAKQALKTFRYAAEFFNVPPSSARSWDAFPATFSTRQLKTDSLALPCMKHSRTAEENNSPCRTMTPQLLRNSGRFMSKVKEERANNGYAIWRKRFMKFARAWPLGEVSI